MKTVNVKTRHPIRSLRYPLSGEYVNVKMHEGEILKCLCGNALVEEVLPNGKIIKLNFKNYDKNNCPQVVAEETKIEKEEDIEFPKTPSLEMVRETFSDLKEIAKEEIVSETIKEDNEEESDVETEEDTEENDKEETVEKNTINKSKKNKRK